MKCHFCGSLMLTERDGLSCPDCGAIFAFCERGEKPPTDSHWAHHRDRLGYFVSAEKLSEQIDDWLSDEDCDEL